MNALLSGDFDGIKHGTSTFIVEKDSIINKRSKKLLDMKHLSEEEWDGLIDPKWYDNLADGPGILCWIRDQDVTIVKSMDEEGMFLNIFEDILGGTDDITPVKIHELEEFLLEGIPVAKKVRKKHKEEPTVEPEVDDGVEITEGNEEGSQSQNSETTVSPKEDAGEESVEDNSENTDETGDGSESTGENEEEIPF